MGYKYLEHFEQHFAVFLNIALLKKYKSQLTFAQILKEP